MSTSVPTARLPEERSSALAGTSVADCKVAVIWIDWYAYHLARFKALVENSWLAGRVAGIELVGGAGVHGKLLFREDKRDALAVTTLFPKSGWADVSQIKAALALWKALDSLNPEAVLVPGYYTLPGLAAAVWAKAHGRRSILMTETTRDDHKRHLLREWGKATLIRSLFDRAIVGGKPHARYLQSLGFAQHRIAGTYDVVDNDFFARGTAELRRNGGPSDYALPERYFLYVGRLAEEKNLGFMIDEFAGYCRNGGNWSLVIAGDGPLNAELRQRAASSGVESRIHFCGMQTAGGLLPYYAFAGCFVLPSTREPWGLVVNEAMAAGLPLIVSNRCGCAEDLVESGQNGYLVDPAIPGSLESRLNDIAALPDSARQLMGRQSRELIANYSPERWAAEVVNCLAI